MKRKKIIGLIILLVILLGYIGLKIFFLNFYNTKDIISKQNLQKVKFSEPLVIKTKTNIEDYLMHNNVKIRNDFKNFEYKKETKGPTIYYYTLKDYSEKNENEKINPTFMMSTGFTYLEYLKEDEVNYFNVKSREVSSKERLAFLKKNKIDSDLDLFRLIEKYKNKQLKNTIFTSFKQIKGNYSVLLMACVFMPDVESITEIKGDYKGYILNLGNAKEVSIIDGKKKYIFTFFNKDYFTDQYIKELLETIIIDRG